MTEDRKMAVLDLLSDGEPASLDWLMRESRWMGAREDFAGLLDCMVAEGLVRAVPFLTEPLFTLAPRAVDHPSHYRRGTGFEAIDVIEAWGLDFALGNVVKYIARAGLKGDAVEDLEKAAWYIRREIGNRRQAGAVIPTGRRGHEPRRGGPRRAGIRPQDDGRDRRRPRDQAPQGDHGGVQASSVHTG